MHLTNLDNFDKHQNYYNLYTNNNSKLNEVIEDIIKKYNFDYNPAKYYRLDENAIVVRNIYEISGITIMLNAIIKKTFYGFCIKTGVEYTCEKMYISKVLYSSYAYHFNCSGDEFVILFGWEYFSPILIYYPKTKDVYNISYRYSNILNHINNNNSTLNDIDYTIAYYPKYNYTSYIIGIMPNAGHYFWQEVNGLMLLIQYDLLDNIDEFVIYKYDYLNIANILKNKYNKNIKYITSNKEINNLTVNVSKHFISNLSINIFKNFYNLSDTNINTSNELNIMFDLRSNSRIWLNQIPIIINIMNGLKNKYCHYNINFYISGFYSYENNAPTNCYDTIRCINLQNNIFNIIQSNVSFPIFNLININLSEIIRIIQNIDLCICNAGSGAGFFYSGIFNKPAIAFTLSATSKIFNIQRYAFENKLNEIYYIHPRHITDIHDNFILKKGILFNSVMSKINDILLIKQSNS